MTNAKKCFAHRHINPGPGSIYGWIERITWDTGTGGHRIYQRNDRNHARHFGKSPIDKDTMCRYIKTLEDDGWLICLDNAKANGLRANRNPKTGESESLRYRLVTHDEWIETHGESECRFPVRTKGEGEEFEFASPVPKTGTGHLSPNAGLPVPKHSLTCPQNGDVIPILNSYIFPKGPEISLSSVDLANSPEQMPVESQSLRCTEPTDTYPINSSVKKTPAPTPIPNPNGLESELESDLNRHGEIEEMIAAQDERRVRRGLAIAHSKEWRSLPKRNQDQVKSLLKHCAAEWELAATTDNDGDIIKAEYREMPKFPLPHAYHKTKLAALLDQYGGSDSNIVKAWREFCRRPEGFDGLHSPWTKFLNDLDIILSIVQVEAANASQSF